jgi:hypothetical protein
MPENIPHDADGARIMDELLSKSTSDLVKQMVTTKKELSLCDWLFYQLIRKVSNTILPKQSDYFRYTILKFHLLRRSGFDPMLLIDDKNILLYIQTNDIIYNLPARLVGDKQYICMNHHDYAFRTAPLGIHAQMVMAQEKSRQQFDFAIDRLPEFPESDYVTGELAFEYGQKKEHLTIKLNKKMKGLFTNYPVTDYSNQFNIPVSHETGSSLINALMPKLAGMSRRKGLEYLLQFTRHAFLFAKDTEIFGREKRLSAEETLLYEKSDCEDRSALYFWLVREIYDLPMIVLSYPDHVTVAVNLGDIGGQTVNYNGNAYTICEPTPQKKDLRIGQIITGIHDRPYQVNLVYTPKKR